MTQALSTTALDQDLPGEQSLYELGQQALDHARACGASDAVVALGSNCGLTTSLRNRELESVEFQRDNDLAITVYFGQKRGHANTGDLKPGSIREIVEAACTIARHTQDDDAAGLPEPEHLASTPMDLALDHPAALSVSASRDWALACEDAAFAGALDIVYRHQPTTRDALFGVTAEGVAALSWGSRFEGRRVILGICCVSFF